MAVNLGEAFYKLTVDEGQLTAGLNQAEAKVKRTSKDIERSLNSAGTSFKQLGSTIKQGLTEQVEGLASSVPIVGQGLGALGAAGLGAGVAIAGLAVAMQQAGAAMVWADDLQATADKIGVTAEYIQEMSFAAADADVPLNALNSGLERLNSSLGAFKSGVGDGRVLEAFKELGIDQAQIRSMNDASDLLPILADRLQLVGSKAEQVQIAKKLGVEELLPLLLKGSENLRLMADEAQNLGVVIDNQTTQSLADMSREVEIASSRIDVNLKKAFLGLAPALTSFSGWMADASGELNKFIGAFNALQKLERQRGMTREEASKQNVAEESERNKNLDRRRVRGGSLSGADNVETPIATPRTSTPRTQSAPRVSAPRSRPAPAQKQPYRKMGWEIKDDEWMMNPASLPGVVQLETDITRIEDLVSRLPEITNPVKDVAFEIGDSFAYAFGQAAAGLGDFGDIFEQEMRRMVASWVSTGIQDIISQLLNGKNGNGGVIGGILNMLGFGGFRAMGGSVAGGRSYVVGENGPEMFVPAGSGSIIPNHKLGAGGGGAVYQTFDLRGAMVDKDVWAEVDRRANMAARRAASVSYSQAVDTSSRNASQSVQRSDLLEG
jgi:hypothetical protein